MFNHMYTMVIVIVGWVFFDTDSISSAIGYIGVMFGFGNNLFINNMDKYIVYTNFLILAVAIIACTQLSIKSNKKINVDFKKMDLKLIIVIQTLILIVSIAFLVSESYNPFLYFRF